MVISSWWLVLRAAANQPPATSCQPLKMYRFLNRPAIAISLLLLPMAGFFAYFFILRYNIPWFDEYENIPYFLQRFLAATTVQEGLDALLRPNNEHRVLYARLIVYGQYLLTGELNFANLMLWGNLGLVVIFALLVRTAQRQSLPFAALLPLPLLLFTAQNYLLTFTAIYTLQYLAIIMLVMATFYALAHPTWPRFGLAIGLGALATFSMGNGLLLWPAGAVMLGLQRRWSAAGIWLAMGALSIWGYFLGYPVQQGNTEGFAYVLAHPGQTLAGFLVFAGSILDIFPGWPVEKRVYLPIVGGLAVVSLLTFWLVRLVLRQVKRVRPEPPSIAETFLLGCALFLLANMGLIAVFRIRFYFGMVLHSSYRTYSLVLWAVAWLMLASMIPQSRQAVLLPTAWGLFLALNLFTYFTYLPEAIQRRKHLQGLTFNQKYSQIGLGGLRNSALSRWINELNTTMHQRGWYDLPQPAIAADESRLLSSPLPPTVTRQDTTNAANGPKLTIIQQPDYVTVTSDEPGYSLGLNRAIYLIFKSSANTYLMLAEPNRPTGWRPFSVIPGWFVPMPKGMVQPGQYRVGLYRTAPTGNQVEWKNDVVRVD